jgi:sodium transport system permease protein
MRMMTQALTIARKELVDHGRDRRAMGSAVLYALMGPAVILLALAARGAGNGGPWDVMAAVFALMAVFTGAMGPATDMIAGERERRTLLPLLVSTSSRCPVIIGKWMAASMFGMLGLLTNVVGFISVFWIYSRAPALSAWILIVPALVSLALLAGAVETLVSAFCRNPKEANTYVSMLMFLAMGFSMWMAFRPDISTGWLTVTPVAGQQRLLELAFSGKSLSSMYIAVITVQSLLLAVATVVATLVALALTWAVFEGEEAVYGG